MVTNRRNEHGFVARLILLGVLCCIAADLAAQQRYPQYPGYGYPYSQPGQQPYPYGGPQYPYGQQPAQGAQPRPSQQGYPARQPTQTWPQSPAPPYGQQPQSAGAAPTRLEVLVSERSPYVQQTVLLTIRISSSGNLSTVQTEIPATGSLIFTKLDGPIVTTRRSAGQQEIVNEYRYAVTPLQSGMTSIPSIRVHGSMAGARDGQAFDLASPASILLDVKPLSPAVQPWLPLHGLTLHSYLEGVDKLEAGQPISLIVNIAAVGATGGQLPSFEGLLNRTDFNVYRESSETEGKISSDGRYLLGQRNEVFTLVPQHGGKIQIPELRVDWWNVNTGRAESSVVPIRQVVARGEPGTDQGKITDLFPGAASLLLWAPLIGLFSVTIGFWILAWLRQKRFMQVVEEELAIVAGFAVRRFRAFLDWLSPIRRLQKVRQIFVRSLPRSFRLWFCVRVVDGEDDPEIWSYMLKFLSNKHLGIPPQLPMKELGDRLIEIHHRADPGLMQQLMQQLDESLYGDGSLDFPSWKRRFREQLRPSIFSLKRRQPGVPRQERLPRLNPGI